MRSVAVITDRFGLKWRVRVGKHSTQPDMLTIGVNPAHGSGIGFSVPREAVPMLIELLKQYDKSMV